MWMWRMAGIGTVRLVENHTSPRTTTTTLAMATAEATVSTQRMRFRESLLQATLCTLLHDLSSVRSFHHYFFVTHLLLQQL